MKNISNRSPIRPIKPLSSVKFAKLCNYFTTQFITGHGNFSSYKERFKIAQNGHKKCIQCNILDDSPEHALLYCSANRDLQNILSESGIRYKNDLQKIVPNEELREIFKELCETIITRRNEIDN